MTRLACMVTLVLGTACGNDSTAVTLGTLGQSCERAGDCESTLACINRVCAAKSLMLTPNGNVCAIDYPTDCKTAADCCTGFKATLPGATCTALNASCTMNPTANLSDCLEYDASCICKPAQRQCVTGQCAQLQACRTDPDCAPGSCVNQGCVECKADTDCTGGDKCKDNRCQFVCDADVQCGTFQSCQSGECVYSGCKYDRECIGLYRTGDAFCDQGKHECSTHCSVDTECPRNPLTPSLRVCIAGACADAGCETDEECKAALGFSGNDGSKAVCRGK